MSEHDQDKNKIIITEMWKSNPLEELVIGPPHTVGLHSRCGGGRTLTALGLSRWLKDAHKVREVDCGVATNVELTFADVRGRKFYEMLSESPAWFHDKAAWVFVLDGGLAAATADLGSGKVLNVPRAVEALRENGVKATLLYTTVYPMEVGYGLLDSTDFWVYCRVVEEARSVETFWWDWSHARRGSDFQREYFPPELGTEHYKFKFHNTDLLFDAYDTREVPQLAGDVLKRKGKRHEERRRPGQEG